MVVRSRTARSRPLSPSARNSPVADWRTCSSPSRVTGSQREALVVIEALLYLTRVSIRNRFALQARRLRQPRYALALILGVGYFWLVLLRPRVQPGRAPTSLWTNLETVAALGVLLLLVGSWLFSGER